MPDAKLIDYTGKHHPDPLYPARLLAFTKNTRLQMTPDTFEAFVTKEPAEILQEMEYMATTIPSSWEFIDFIFLFTNVRRSTAQQVTRTRTATFAMQSQRVNNMADVTWDSPSAAALEIEPEEGACSLAAILEGAYMDAISSYEQAVAAGATLEEAREILPVGVHCNLVAKYNLRTLAELCQKRDSLRVQGPYVELVAQMKTQVLAAMPWTEPFFRPKQEASIRLIEEVAKELAALEGEKGAMYKGLSGKLAKASDLLKGSQ